MSDDRPLSLSVELVRQEMMRGILIPRDLVNKALKKTADKLDAMETKFFAHKGVVVSERVVEDHTTQLAAADQIYSLSGLYARERMATLGPPTVALEVDSRTGVIRLVVGSDRQAFAAPPEESSPSLVEASAAEAFVEASAEVVALAVRPRKIPLPASFYRIILDEIVE